jgi:predicted phosphodiesterase
MANQETNENILTNPEISQQSWSSDKLEISQQSYLLNESYFKIQLVSDLHIEFKNNDIPNVEDYLIPSAPRLIMAGDIGTFYKYEQLLGFLTKVCKLYTQVFYVMGNHEYYMQKDIPPLTFDEIEKRKLDLQRQIGNLFILDRSSVTFGNICLIGCTLWSRTQLFEIPKFIVKINGINIRNYNSKFEEDFKYIKKTVEHCKENNLIPIVITHYVPTFDVITEEKMNFKFRSLYVTDLNNFIKDSKIHTWICGHTHKNFDKKVYDTRVISNQKGKARDRVFDYSKEFVLEFPLKEEIKSSNKM